MEKGRLYRRADESRWVWRVRRPIIQGKWVFTGYKGVAGSVSEEAGTVRGHLVDRKRMAMNEPEEAGGMEKQNGTVNVQTQES